MPMRHGRSGPLEHTNGSPRRLAGWPLPTKRYAATARTVVNPRVKSRQGEETNRRLDRMWKALCQAEEALRQWPDGAPWPQNLAPLRTHLSKSEVGIPLPAWGGGEDDRTVLEQWRHVA